MVKEFLTQFFNKSHRKIINKVDNRRILITKKNTLALKTYLNNQIFIILNIQNLEPMHAFQ